LTSSLPGIRVQQLLILGSPGFWGALNGRYISELVKRYGFFTPCVGCHVYLHSVRIPLALTLGKIPIISGERERHDESIKVNQISEALNVYKKITEEFGIELLSPMRNIKDGKEVKDILGIDWEEGKEQLECVLAGNYRKVDGTSDITSGQVRRYLEEFAYPLTKKIITTYNSGFVPKHIQIAAEMICR
jgi:hypothetical protein